MKAARAQPVREQKQHGGQGKGNRGIPNGEVGLERIHRRSAHGLQNYQEEQGEKGGVATAENVQRNMVDGPEQNVLRREIAEKTDRFQREPPSKEGHARHPKREFARRLVEKVILGKEGRICRVHDLRQVVLLVPRTVQVPVEQYRQKGHCKKDEMDRNAGLETQLRPGRRRDTLNAGFLCWHRNRWWTSSIQWPERPVSFLRLSFVLRISVSNRPTSLVQAAYLSAGVALPQPRGASLNRRPIVRGRLHLRSPPVSSGRSNRTRKSRFWRSPIGSPVTLTRGASEPLHFKGLSQIACQSGGSRLGNVGLEGDGVSVVNVAESTPGVVVHRLTEEPGRAVSEHEIRAARMHAAKHPRIRPPLITGIGRWKGP